MLKDLADLNAQLEESKRRNSQLVKEKEDLVRFYEQFIEQNRTGLGRNKEIIKDLQREKSEIGKGIMQRAGHLLSKLGGSEKRNKTKKRVGGNVSNAQGEAIEEENDDSADDDN